MRSIHRPRSVRSSMFIVLVFLTCAGSGCAPSGPPFQAVQPIPSNKGIVYVYQLSPAYNGFFPVPAEVLINNSAVGRLLGNDYVAFQCTPGPVTVSTGWGEGLIGAGMNVEAGQQYYIRIQSTGQDEYRVEFRPKVVAEGQAMSELKDCRLSRADKGLTAVFSGTVTPGVNLSDIKSAYVCQDDASTTAPLVADRLRAQGLTVKTGLAKDRPADTQCQVTIEEHWFWDLATYLLQLHIELLNPQTKVPYATATVCRAKPEARHGPNVMATEVVNAIYNNGYPPGVAIAPQMGTP
jgi:hypothetical protein